MACNDFNHCIRKQGELEDISLYMERFDSLYEQGRMEGLMLTASQKRVRDVRFISDWENSYLTGNGMDDDVKPIDYDGLIEKAEQVEHITVQTPETEKNQMVEEFKRKTEELFHAIREQTPGTLSRWSLHTYSPKLMNMK